MNFRRLIKAVIPRRLFHKIEPMGHLAEAVVLNIINGFPASGMKVIGVTGTNGKTTTCYLIQRILMEAGYKTGLMTTVAYGINDRIESQKEHYTNVPVPELMRRLKWMKSQGIDWLVLETTSQALAQHRVFGVPFSLAVMTNVTHEHLDYHGTFERYRDAKRKLFKKTNRNRRGLRVGVINADDPSAKLFEADIAKPITYGVKQGIVRAKNIKSTPKGSEFDVHHVGEDFFVSSNLPGSFNVYNVLAATAVGLALELEPKTIEQGILALKIVEGRMQSVHAGQPYDVIVDFAHTPDSFEKLFKDMRPMVKGKLIVMFGSAGRRDEAKRAVQGGLAGKYADEVIVTEEDDRDINGLEIMEEIAEGAEKAGKVRDKNLFLVHDREMAINFAFSRANPGDTVLLLGKGHERTIARAHGDDPWDEVAIARHALSRH